MSDVYAPLSGEVTEVNSAVAEKPEKINEDPYGEGWMVKVKLSDPSEADQRWTPPRTRSSSRNPTRALRPIGGPHYDGSSVSRYTSATDRDRQEMLAAIGASFDRRALRGHPRGAATGTPAGAPDGKPETEVYDRLSALASRNTHAEWRRALGAGMYDHYVPAVVDAITSRSSS